MKIGLTSSDAFNTDNFQQMADPPTEGGAHATFATNFDNEIFEVATVQYFLKYKM